MIYTRLAETNNVSLLIATLGDFAKNEADKPDGSANYGDTIRPILGRRHGGLAEGQGGAGRPEGRATRIRRPSQVEPDSRGRRARQQGCPIGLCPDWLAILMQDKTNNAKGGERGRWRRLTLESGHAQRPSHIEGHKVKIQIPLCEAREPR